MGFIHVAVAVLSLLSAGQSAPVTNCETLIQPADIQGRDQLLGKWTYIGESTNLVGSRYLTKMFVDSAWVKITAANESDAINLFQAQKMFGRCFTLTTKMTLENSTLSMEQPFAASEIKLTSGCPDCLVLYSKYTIGNNTYRGLQFMSKRDKVSDAELGEFNKQVKCLNLPTPAILDPEKGFCPDESSSEKMETIDLTNFMTDIDTEFFQLFDSTFSSKGGMEILIEMISRSIAALKEN